MNSIDDPNTLEAQKVIKRYRDGYRVARALAGLGSFAQGIAGLVIVAGLLYALLADGSPLRFVVPFLAFIFGFIIYVLGTLVAAHGQGIMAQFDAAVHTTPFLSDGQKALAMSL